MYYRTVAATRTFSTCDHHLFRLLWRWARFRHPNKSRAWLKRKYWTTRGRNTWSFAAPDGKVLSSHARVTIRLHVKVKGTASPLGRDNDSCIFEPFGTFTRIRQLECGRAKRHGGGFAREIPLYGQQQTA